MEKKFYVLFLFITFSGLFKARAQDTTSCTAYFYVSYNGDQVYFRAVDSISGTQQRWYFGDSAQLGFGSNVGVTHTYAGPGTYVVSLVVRNTATGCYDSSAQVIAISPPPPSCGISFYYSHDSTISNSLYSFYAVSYTTQMERDTFFWSINGTLAGLGDTLKRVLQPGQYTICAALSAGPGGCQYCQTISVTDSAATPPVVVPPDTAITIPPNIPPDSNVVPPPDTSIIIMPNIPPSDSLANFLSSYPNPVSGQVHMDLKTDRAEMIYIRVYNSMGSIVQTVAVSGIQGTNQLSLNVSGLQSGVYSIQIQYGSEIKRSRIQKL